MKLPSLLLALPLAAALLGGCKKDSDSAGGSFTIDMDAQVRGNAFALNTPVALALPDGQPSGQSFTATAFKYYVSNFRLLRGDGSAYEIPESYFLVDADRPQTAKLSFSNIPLGEYTGISFIAGVDAGRNTAGAQTGALDPSNGMFWDWNQGYIFTRLDGTSPNSPNGALTFHIGGVPNVRTVTIPFGNAKLAVGDHHAPSIHMLVHPTALFENTTPANRIDFTTTFRVKGTTGIANTIADNIATGMFTLGHVHNH